MKFRSFKLKKMEKFKFCHLHWSLFGGKSIKTRLSVEIDIFRNVNNITIYTTHLHQLFIL